MVRLSLKSVGRPSGGRRDWMRALPVTTGRPRTGLRRCAIRGTSSESSIPHGQEYTLIPGSQIIWRTRRMGRGNQIIATTTSSVIPSLSRPKTLSGPFRRKSRNCRLELGAGPRVSRVHSPVEAHARYHSALNGRYACRSVQDWLGDQGLVRPVQAAALGLPMLCLRGRHRKDFHHREPFSSTQ